MIPLKTRFFLLLAATATVTSSALVMYGVDMLINLYHTYMGWEPVSKNVLYFSLWAGVVRIVYVDLIRREKENQ